MEMIEQIQILPAKIKEKEIEILDLSEKYDYFISGQKTRETRLMKEITDEVVDGKQIYTNEIKRKIELAKRLKEDTNYEQLCLEINNLKRKISEENINLSYLKRRFTAIVNIYRRGE